MLNLFDGESGVSETFRLIEKQLGNGCWSWDLRTNKMDWSRGYYDLLGIEPGSITPSFAAIQQVTHPEDRPPQAQIERIIRDASSIKRRFRVIQPSGKIVWISCQITVLVNTEGVSVRAIGICSNITQYQEALSPLRITEERYKALLKATRALVWIGKSDGKTQEYPNWTDFRTEPIETVLDKAWIDYVHPDDRDQTIRIWNEAQESKRDCVIEHRVRQSDGSYAWKRTHGVPILDQSGTVQEWLGTNADIQQEKFALRPVEHNGRLTGAQIRAARGLLRWSAEDLAEASGTSRATIRRLEESDGLCAASEPSVKAIEAALSEAGVEFIFPEIGKPGVRPR